MDITSHSAELRETAEAWRKEQGTVGFVPTMGALHEGHMALVRRARKENSKVIASIFVNPTQFGPKEDLSRYPRTPEEDVRLLEKEGADLVYMPTAEAMYPEGFTTTVHVKGVTEHLEGAFRPGHFDGVATVVAKLFSRVGACTAYFGEKDWQQLQVINRLVLDLDLPVKVVGVPTVREEDGLALSSRNRYLSEDERKKAALINKALKETAEAIRKDPAGIEAMLEAGQRQLENSGFRLDYFECADAATCTPVRKLEKPARLLVAAWLGNTRLIDNWPV
jgi:pantoate--beta-alanine ligase